MLSRKSIVSGIAMLVVAVPLFVACDPPSSVSDGPGLSTVGPAQPGSVGVSGNAPFDSPIVTGDRGDGSMAPETTVEPADPKPAPAPELDGSNPLSDGSGLPEAPDLDSARSQINSMNSQGF